MIEHIADDLVGVMPQVADFVPAKKNIVHKRCNNMLALIDDKFC